MYSLQNIELSYLMSLNREFKWRLIDGTLAGNVGHYIRKDYNYDDF